VKLEEQVANISCNMDLLMMALVNNFGPFGEVGCPNLKVVLDNKYEIMKTRKKDQDKEK
jgi:hypothetical protein